MSGISYKPSKTKVELDPAERLACMKLGMHLKAAAAGVSMLELAEMLGFEKEAQKKQLVSAALPAAVQAADQLYTRGKTGLGDALTFGKGLGSTVVLASAFLGIPLGVTSHLMTQAMNKRRAKEQKLLQETEYYDDATRNLAANMASFRG